MHFFCKTNEKTKKYYRRDEHHLWVKSFTLRTSSLSESEDLCLHCITFFLCVSGAVKVLKSSVRQRRRRESSSSRRIPWCTRPWCTRSLMVEISSVVIWRYVNTETKAHMSVHHPYKHLNDSFEYLHVCYGHYKYYIIIFSEGIDCRRHVCSRQIMTS